MYDLMPSRLFYLSWCPFNLTPVSLLVVVVFIVVAASILDN